MRLKKTVLFVLLPFCLLQSCRNETEKQAAVVKGAKPAVNVAKPVGEPQNAMLKPVEETIEGYTFLYGYTAYDNDKYEGSNPGYLEIKKGGKVVFKDTFKGEGEPYVTSLGYHNLDGNKLVFRLNYGTEACDYTQTAKYYVADATGKLSYINSYWALTGGDQYASRYFTHIFPEDSLGKPNSLTIVEGIHYHEHDQPDVADTTHIVFSGNNFKMHKLSDNLGKEE